MSEENEENYSWNRFKKRPKSQKLIFKNNMICAFFKKIFDTFCKYIVIWKKVTQKKVLLVHFHYNVGEGKNAKFFYWIPQTKLYKSLSMNFFSTFSIVRKSCGVSMLNIFLWLKQWKFKFKWLIGWIKSWKFLFKILV